MARNTPEAAPHPWPHPMRLATLNRAGPTAFDLTATADERTAITRFLDLASLSALRWRGTLAPEGDDGWRMDGRLTADLEQTCVVTLDSVRQRVDQRIVRHFVPEDMAGPIDLDPESDDDPDTFTDVIDPGAVAVEALALALDPYPRADGTDTVEMRATPPGAAEMDDEAMKPFAGLASLKEKLEKG